MNIQPYLVEESVSVLEAVKKLNIAGKKILFITREKKLVASFADGDVRRWLLKKGDMDVPVSLVANYKPRFLVEGTEEQAKKLMKETNFDVVPIVNQEHELISIQFRYNTPKKRVNLNLPVVIMAGGKGTRLYPYTQILPKPLIPIGDQSITEHIIHQFQEFGCSDFHLIVNHKKNMIKAYFNELERKNFTVNFIDEDVFLGTGGGISLLKGCVDSTFILSNCDILISDDFEKIYQYHQEKEHKVTMICAQKKLEVPYGVINLDDEGVLKSIDEKPTFSFLTNTGCYVVEPEVMDTLEQGEVIGFPDIIARLQKQGEKVGVYSVEEEAWMDMGQLEEMEKMSKKLGF